MNSEEKPTLVDEFTSTPEGMLEFQQAKIALDVSQLIKKAITSQNTNKYVLASKLGKSVDYVVALREGEINLSLSEIVHILFVLGQRLNLSTTKLDDLINY